MAHQVFQQDSQGVYRVAPLERFSWLEHGFGTRVSAGWPDPARLAMLKQIHSATVVTLDGRTGYIGEGDALVTNRRGLLAGVRTADCVPILLVDSRHRAVAAVHAGWRGTAAEIVRSAILELVRQFGTDPVDVWGAIGPSIGSCCYEVGPEVASRFVRWWPEFEGIAGHVKLDLARTNRLQLIESGLPEEQIFSGAPCTVCTNTLHSYRRDGDAAGRMIAAVGIR